MSYKRFVVAPSYIVFLDEVDAIYKTRNGLTGRVTEYANKKSAQQGAVDALTNGGTVFLQENTLDGTVTYGATILIIEDYQGSRKFYRNGAEIDEVGSTESHTHVEADITDLDHLTEGEISLTNLLEKAHVSLTSVTASQHHDKTEAYSVTITAGNTTVVQAHTIGSTPKVTISPTCELGGRVFWVTKDASNVTVHIDSADPFDNFTFDIILTA